MEDIAEIGLLDSSERAALERGEVVVRDDPVSGAKAPALTAWAVFDVPPERVWPLIDRTDRYAETMQRVVRAEELSRRDEGDEQVIRAKVTIEMPFPLPNLTAVTEARHRTEEGKCYERRWRLLEGDYRRNEGNWLLVAHGDDGSRTLVRYRLVVEPKVRVPAKLQRAGQKRAIPQLMLKLRRLATEG